MNITPSEEESWGEKKFSVEKGYYICLAFFVNIWSYYERKVVNIPEKDIYKLFFCTICGSAIDSEIDWNDAIFHTLGIVKENQRGLKLSAKELFLCSIEFCKIHNDRFGNKLADIVSLLKAMLKKPDQYSIEWSLWTKAFCKIEEYSNFDFNWDTTFIE